MKCVCSEVMFDDIKHLSGTNPLLLSLFKSTHTVQNYSTEVDTLVRNFLNDNLSLKNDPKHLKDFLIHRKIGETRKYVYSAYQL